MKNLGLTLFMAAILAIVTACCSHHVRRKKLLDYHDERVSSMHEKSTGVPLIK